MPGYFVLDGHTPTPVDLWTWAQACEARHRLPDDPWRVARTTVGDCTISTVFLGLDHNWQLDGPPILFETLIFEGELDGEMWRYPTWDAALAGHDQAVAMVRQTAWTRVDPEA